ncbi:unnamed protein product, partial [Phaeothamnion confervicola]
PRPPPVAPDLQHRHLAQEAQLYAELLKAIREQGTAVRSTIVRSWGSTPREVGAKMLVLAQGEIKGTVGGGCGEAEVWQEARNLTAKKGSTAQVHVDLTEGPESKNGKVCGGRFDVFME